jgi:DNA-binding transcriptional MerR regulator
LKNLDIAEVGRRSGLPPSTLRFYEEKGLISSNGRRGLRRVFPPEVLERLALITLGRAAGFSLDEIGRMFAAQGSPRIDRRLLAAKADELDKVIRKLVATRDGLRHAAACPARTQLECPTFRRYLRVVTRGAFGAPGAQPLRPERKRTARPSLGKKRESARPVASRNRTERARIDEKLGEPSARSDHRR